MCPMEIAYCFQSIAVAVGCSNVDEAETVPGRFPSLSLIAEDYFEDWDQTNLFDSCRLEDKLK